MRVFNIVSELLLTDTKMGQLASISKDPILHNHLKSFQRLRTKLLRDVGESDPSPPQDTHPQEAASGPMSL